MARAEFMLLVLVVLLVVRLDAEDVTGVDAKYSIYKTRSTEVNITTDTDQSQS